MLQNFMGNNLRITLTEVVPMSFTTRVFCGGEGGDVLGFDIVWSLHGIMTQIIIIIGRCAQQMTGTAWKNSLIFVTFVSIFQSVQCLAMGWMTGRLRFDPWQRRKDFSCSLCVQTSSGAHPASCTMGTGGPIPGAKAWSGHDTDHSPPSSAKV
jgi:hypothetical protein